MKLFIKNNKLLSIFSLALIVLIPVLVFAIDQVDEGYRLGPGQTKTIYHKDASGQTSPISYHLSNSGSVTYFIPTRTLLEFESLYWNYSGYDLTLDDYCGNGLCGFAGIASGTGSPMQRVKYNPPNNVNFEGYAWSSENEYTPCPQDCGPIFCGDGDCTSDFYEDYSNCTADCKRCSSLDYYKCSYEYSGDKTGTCSDGWTTDYYKNHCN